MLNGDFSMVLDAVPMSCFLSESQTTQTYCNQQARSFSKVTENVCLAEERFYAYKTIRDFGDLLAN